MQDCFGANAGLKAVFRDFYAELRKTKYAACFSDASFQAFHVALDELCINIWKKMLKSPFQAISSDPLKINLFYFTGLAGCMPAYLQAIGLIDAGRLLHEKMSIFEKYQIYIWGVRQDGFQALMDEEDS